MLTHTEQLFDVNIRWCTLPR